MTIFRINVLFISNYLCLLAIYYIQIQILFLFNVKYNYDFFVTFLFEIKLFNTY